MSVRKSKLTFDNEENVLCFHGPLLYEAKILKGEFWDGKEGEIGPHYYVHYKGWKVKWDEWVGESRVLKLNDANMQIKKELKEKSSKKERSEGGEAPLKKPRLDDAPKGKDLDLEIPEKLVGMMVDDWEYVTKQQMLVPLPRNPTVAGVLEEFYEKKLKSGDADGALKEIVTGLKSYFDMALGKMLLYRFERIQYLEIRKERGEEAKMSEVYGTEHLLRLFMKTQQLISTVRMEPDAIATLNDVLNDLIKFIMENHTRFILEVYDNASQDYLSVIRAF